MNHKLYRRVSTVPYLLQAIYSISPSLRYSYLLTSLHVKSVVILIFIAIYVIVLIITINVVGHDVRQIRFSVATNKGAGSTPYPLFSALRDSPCLSTLINSRCVFLSLHFFSLYPMRYLPHTLETPRRKLAYLSETL